MNTDEAFVKLVSSRYRWKKAGLSDGLRRRYRHRLKMNKPILVDTKVRLLTQAGLRQATIRF